MLRVRFDTALGLSLDLACSGRVAYSSDKPLSEFMIIILMLNASLGCQGEKIKLNTGACKELNIS